jgi:hypothetical protein
METRVPAPLLQHEQQTSGQLVQAPNVSSLSLESSMLRTVIVVQQFMTELNGAVSEEKIVAITEIVLNLVKQNDH